jgi:hypothetical protein
MTGGGFLGRRGWMLNIGVESTFDGLGERFFLWVGEFCLS